MKKIIKKVKETKELAGGYLNLNQSLQLLKGQVVRVEDHTCDGGGICDSSCQLMEFVKEKNGFLKFRVCGFGAGCFWSDWQWF